MKSTRLVTAESVRRGHPDKLCDQIADRILDAHLTVDPNARVAVEVFATAGRILVAGEVTSAAEVDYRKIVWALIDEIGYAKADVCLDALGRLDIDVLIHEQSLDIAHAVDGADQLGAGDQGIMVGYATDETPEHLPLPVVLAHQLCRQIDTLARKARWLGADGKAQVTVSYEDDNAKEITAIVVSAQHTEDTAPDILRERILANVIQPVIPPRLITANTLMLINPSGKFVLGGPAADTGLTGRKLAVDQYGPVARMGGGALSAKDPTKVDRSGAYAARWIARNIVAARLARHCEVQIAYAIGRAEPVSVSVDTFGTGTISDALLALAVLRAFDLRPSSIIDQLRLRTPIYSPLAAYGHYGRTELDLPWERMDRHAALLRAAEQISKA